MLDVAPKAGFKSGKWRFSSGFPKMSYSWWSLESWEGATPNLNVNNFSGKGNHRMYNRKTLTKVFVPYMWVFFQFPQQPGTLNNQFFMVVSIGWFKIFTWEMVGNHQTSIYKWVFRVPAIQMFYVSPKITHSNKAQFPRFHSHSQFRKKPGVSPQGVSTPRILAPTRHKWRERRKHHKSGPTWSISWPNPELSKTKPPKNKKKHRIFHYFFACG